MAPAVAGDLFVVGSTLVYHGMDADNVITVSGTDGNLTISDAAGTIDSTVPGLSAGGSNTLTGAVPSYIQAIAINGGNGTDTIAVNGLATARKLILSATTITNSATITAASVTESGTIIGLGGTIQTNAGPLGGPVTFNGTLSLSGPGTIDTQSTLDGDVTFNGPVVGAQDLTVQAGNITARGAIHLGGGTTGLTLDGDNVSLQEVIDQVQVSIDAQNAVTLNGAMISGGTISILANEDGAGGEGFTQVQGDIITTAASAFPAVAIEVNQNGGTGNATVRGITTGADSTVLIDTQPTSGSGGGAIVDGNGPGVLNVDVPFGVAGGTLTLLSGPTGIDLDTSVANLTAVLPTTGSVLDADVRNSGQALDVQSVTTGGNFSVSNDQALSVNDVNAEGNITLRTTAAGSDIAVNSVESGGTSGTLTIDSSGAILGPLASSATAAVGAANVVATAINGIGTAANPFYVASPNALVTFSGATDRGGMYITYGVETLQVNQATAGGGDVTIVPNGGLNLTIDGNVSTEGSGAVTLDASFGSALVFDGGTVSSDTGAITLSAGSQITIPANETVSTGGNIVIGDDAANFIQLSDGVVDAAGTVAAGGSLTLDGGTNSTLLTVAGTLAAGGVLSIDSTLSTASSTLLLGGRITSAGNLSVSTGGPTFLLTDGTIDSGGTTTLGNAGLGASLTMQLGGTIQSAGLVTINGASGGFATVLTLTGSLGAGAGVNITSHGAAAGDTFDLTTSGAIAGTTVTISGSTGDANTFNLGGSVTARAGDITVTAAGDGSANAFDVTGAFSASGTTNLVGGSGADSFVVVPSTTSTFTFSGIGVYSLQISTPSADLVSAPADFSTSIVFAPATALKTWTRAGGTWLVTPTAP